MDLQQEYERLTENVDQFREDLMTYGDTILTERLKFSTGGMRGIIREGFNGINEVTCNLLCTALSKRYSSICIGYDGRIKSDVFAKIAEKIFKGKGKAAYVFEYIPTPCLSHFIGVLGTECGLMVTASHNPKEYNGFKVYDRNGCQITSPIDKEIEDELLKNEITDLNLIKNEVQEINENIPSREDLLMGYVKDMFEGWKPDQMPRLRRLPFYKILFTPLYGVSNDVMRLGIRHYDLLPLFDFLEKQCYINQIFPGLPFPNPEVEQVYEEAKRCGYEFVFSCDPDGDRFGMIEKVYDAGVYDVSYVSHIHYSGDEIAAILIKFFIDHFDHSSLVFINTFLCDDFMETVAKKFEIEYHQTMTGFKNISKVINEVYERKENKFVFAYEDSLGFFFGKGREKDGIKCALLMGHILQCTRPSEILTNIRDEYGIYSTYSHYYRCENPEEVLTRFVSAGEWRVFHDMFIKECEDHKLILRKSGTEPVIKIYGSSRKLEENILADKIMEVVDGLSK